jgi:hypothetical protein
MTVDQIRAEFEALKASGQADTLRIVFYKSGEVRSALFQLRSRTVWRWPEGFHSPMSSHELTTHNWSGRKHFTSMSQGHGQGFVI